MTAEPSECQHLLKAGDPNPRARAGCEDCLAIGDTWVHLRLCLQCAHVGCCDSSKNRHATKHFHSTKHPVIRSFEPGRYCYVDDLFIEG